MPTTASLCHLSSEMMIAVQQSYINEFSEFAGWDLEVLTSESKVPFFPLFSAFINYVTV